MQRYALSSGPLYASVTGAGEPLLLVHGFPLDHSMWSEQIAPFSATHQVIAPDLRGFGKSPATPGTVTMEQFADDLAELLATLGVTQPVTLCGLSMGGYIAFAFARRHRERLARLILCDTRADADAQTVRTQRAATAERVRREGTEFLATSMTERLFARSTIAQRPEVIGRIQAVIRAGQPEGVAAASLGMAERSDARPLLAELRLPTLVLVGAEDVISPPAEMRELARKIRAARFVEIPDAGHMAPLEQPARVNAAIHNFLQPAEQ